MAKSTAEEIWSDLECRKNDLDEYLKEIEVIDLSHPLYPSLQNHIKELEECLSTENQNSSSFLQLKSDIWIGDDNNDWRTTLHYLILELPVDMETISNCLGELERLQHLKITGTKLKYLPNSITRLRELQELELQWCRSLEQLPEDLDQLVSLTELSIRGSKIRALPKSIAGLSNLQVLDIEECFSLEDLPPNMDELINLRKLSVKYCGIKYIPNTILRLHNLKILDFRGCFNLKELPANLCELVNLEKFHIRGTNIKFLPCSIKRLSNLEVLDLPDCFGFRKLQDNLNKLFSKIPLDRFVQDEIIPLDASDDIQVLGGSLIFESNLHPLCDVDNGMVGVKASRNEDSHGMTTFVEDLISVEDTNNLLAGTSNDDSNITGDGMQHHNVDNRQMSTASTEKHVNLNTQITSKESQRIFSLLAQGKKLIDAADEIGVSRSTFKRKCRKNGIHNWSESRMDNLQYPKNQKRNAKSTSRRVSSQIKSHNPRSRTDGDEHVLCSLDSTNTLSTVTTDTMMRTMEATREEISSEMSRHDNAEPATNTNGDEHVLGSLNASNTFSTMKMMRTTEESTKETCSEMSQHNTAEPTSHTTGDEHVPGTLNASTTLSTVTMMRTTKESTKETCSEMSHHDNAAPSGFGSGASSSSFLVKASYKEDILRFHLASTSGIAQLKGKVKERLELEDGKYKIHYQDDDMDWVLMACNDDLHDCLHLSASSGKYRVALKILDS